MEKPKLLTIGPALQTSTEHPSIHIVMDQKIISADLDLIPMAPVLPGGMLSSFRGRSNSVRNIAKPIYVNSATAGIYHALRNENIQTGDEVLLPAYICESVFEVVLETGAKPVFYKIKPNTNADLDDIELKCTSNTKVLIVAHLFGVRQDIGEIRIFCDTHKISLIEDCAHVYFCTHSNEAGHPVSDYIVVSLPKFFAVYDGGILLSPRHKLSHYRGLRRNLIYEIGSFYNELEISSYYDKTGLLRLLIAIPMHLKKVISGLKSGRQDTSHAQGKNSNEKQGYLYFDRDTVFYKASIASIIISRLSEGSSQIIQRRKNYKYLKKNLAGVRGVSKLGICDEKIFAPYVYPILIHNPETVKELRDAGVPFWMWENIHNDICEVSNMYSRQLIQLPCHQSVTRNSLDKMIQAIKEIVDK